MTTSELKNNNPWIELTDKIIANGYNLLEQNSLNRDKSIIDFYNQNQSSTYKLKTSMLPAHFSGNIFESKVILLASNPGFDENEVDTFYCKPKYIQERINELTFKSKVFLQDDEERKNVSPYWYNKIKFLSDEIGFKYTTPDISLLQFNPYHSIKFRIIAKKYFKSSKDQNISNYLHSQNYGFELLRYCIESNKLIVVLRSKTAWFNAVNELYEHERLGKVITIKNKRQPVLSPNNFETLNGFESILDTLNKK